MKTFKYFSPESKLWVYQSSREITNDEYTLLNERLVTFCKEWTAHNKQLMADFDIVYDRFVVLVVDETGHTASGCSIDKSVHFLKEAGAELGIDFFDKLQIPYMAFGELLTAPYNQLKSLYKEGDIEEETLFFDTNVQNLGDYTGGFVKPLNRHWLMSKLT